MNWKKEQDKKDEEHALAPPGMTTEDKFNVLSSPYWILVFVLLATPLFVMLTLIGNQIQVQGTSPEQVYAFNALFAGIMADLFLRRWLFVSLVIIRTPKVPFIIFWVVACFFVYAFEPFGFMVRLI